MARKKGSNYYFEMFVELVQYSCDAADLLNNIIKNFNKNDLAKKMKEMHNIEHSADKGKHELMEKLAHEFITPIEREDIIALADAIDNVTDTIEDVLQQIYMFNISEMREDALKMAANNVKCCEALKKAVQEFGNFQKSSSIKDLIIEINDLEEDGDELFITATRNLFTEEKDPVLIIAWREVFDCFERVIDVCEDASEVIANVIMKNS